MCKLESQILNIKAQSDLTNDQIAQRMGAIYEKPITHDSVAKYFSGQQTGIPLDKIEAFLGAFGLKVVGQSDVCLPQTDYDAMINFADKGMEALKSKASN